MRREASVGAVIVALSIFVLGAVFQMTSSTSTPSSSSESGTLLRTQAEISTQIENQTTLEGSVINENIPSLRSNQDDRAESPQTSAAPKIIYTFYSPMEGKKRTGMTVHDDQRLIEAWKAEWRRSGWEPRVISLDTARQHPDFERLNNLLLQDGMPFGEYDRYCFLRWLAMSAVGGGIMADYDTFPLHTSSLGGDNTPNNGRLTVHEHSTNGGVPDLVSGSAEEWHRLTKLLIDNAVQHKNETHWSDMFAMQSLYVESGGTIYIMEKNVVPGQVLLQGNVVDERHCRRTSGKYAVHFSHFAIENGNVKEGSGPQHRAEIATDWVQRWRDACLVGKSQTL